MLSLVHIRLQLCFIFSLVPFFPFSTQGNSRTSRPLRLRAGGGGADASQPGRHEAARTFLEEQAGVGNRGTGQVKLGCARFGQVRL